MQNQLSHLVGSKIKRDVFNAFGLVLIPANTILDIGHLEIIIKHHITIDDHDVEYGQLALQSNDLLVYQATAEIKEIFQTIRSKQAIPLEEVNNNVIPTIYKAMEYSSLYGVLSGLQAKDDYTYRHNIGVGVISTMLGKWLNVGKEELRLLSIAATLHDVGKVHIDDDILNKPGKYSDEEYEIMKKHTTYGYEIINNTPGIPKRMALVALQHHEREDGKGYPSGIKGDQIDYHSKIVAVADVFHAMTSKRVYRNATPFYQVIQQMNLDGFGKLDPSICATFVQRMMEMSIGSEVLLTDGRRGRIIMVHPRDPVNPLVQIDNHYIDLSKDRQTHIQEIVG